MPISALFFGDLDTLAETGELRRRAHNRAFAEADLDWIWDRDSYRRLCTRARPAERIARYAENAGDTVDVRALRAASTRHFVDLVAQVGLAPRPGIAETLAAARARGLKTALCATAPAEAVAAVLGALAPDIAQHDFDWVGDAARAARAKPAPDIYNLAIGLLDVGPGDALVIEDAPDGLDAALAAGCRVVAFPSAMVPAQAIQPGLLVVDRLQPRLLQGDGAGMVAAAE